MNGDHSGLRRRRTAPQDRPVLTLDIHRVLDDYARQVVRAEFRFEPDNPMIVSVTLAPARGAHVTWHIGRELLRRGLHEDSGEGDVQMWPTQSDDQKAWLLLEAKDVTALFELPVPTVAEWLEATYRIVPAEAELSVLDWDGFFEELLDARERPAG